MLGERLQYVLLPGERLQDEAAEDPLTAALGNRMADCELYWRAKLQRPLQEVFATCLSHAALQVILPARSHCDSSATFKTWRQARLHAGSDVWTSYQGTCGPWADVSGEAQQGCQGRSTDRAGSLLQRLAPLAALGSPQHVTMCM